MGKIIYRINCETKLASDSTIPSNIIKIWPKWESSLTLNVKIPRSIVQSRGVTKIDLHDFCDSSKVGFGAVGYHPGGSSQGLIASKSFKKHNKIPRLKLIAPPMQGFIEAILLSVIRHKNLNLTIEL